MFCFEFLLFFFGSFKVFMFCFTSMHLADAFIQSDLHCNCAPCFWGGGFVTHFSIHLFISLLTYSTITFWRLFILKSCYKNREKSDFCPSFKLICERLHPYNNACLCFRNVWWMCIVSSHGARWRRRSWVCRNLRSPLQIQSSAKRTPACRAWAQNSCSTSSHWTRSVDAYKTPSHEAALP